MREGLLVVACIALLMAAAGLGLWQWARTRQTRLATGKHLSQQILGGNSAAVVAPKMATEAPAEAYVAGLTGDPWGDTAASAAAGPQQSPLEKLMPGWLEGALAPGLLVLVLGGILALSVLAAAFGGWPGAIGVLLVLLLGATFWLWLRVQKFRSKLIAQLPSYIDAMVRLITIGNSTQAAFQLAIATTQEPLRGHLDRSAALVRAGLDLDRALHQTATNVRVEELFLLASILGLGVRYGGRADLLLERVGNFMRDREQAEQELTAMSAETRLSAWILGLLPVAVGTFLVLTNPSYFMGMWNDGTGRILIFSALGLQLTGAALLYRLAKLA